MRELKSNPHLGLEPVGFLDDDLGKHDVKIHGVPVLGDRHGIPAAVKKHQVRQVIIAMPTARGVEIRDIVRICGEAGVQARTLAPAHTAGAVQVSSPAFTSCWTAASASSRCAMCGSRICCAASRCAPTSAQ